MEDAGQAVLNDVVFQPSAGGDEDEMQRIIPERRRHPNTPNLNRLQIYLSPGFPPTGPQKHCDHPSRPRSLHPPAQPTPWDE